MKTIDFHQFEKMVKTAGYSISVTKKHHAILRPDGKVLTRFPIHHAKGQKRFVLEIYVKRIIRAIAEDQNS